MTPGLSDGKGSFRSHLTEFLNLFDDGTLSFSFKGTIPVVTILVHCHGLICQCHQFYLISFRFNLALLLCKDEPVRVCAMRLFTECRKHFLYDIKF